MRFSVANLLLLGAAIAAPVQDVDHRSKEVEHGNFISRGLVPILPRAVVPVKPPVVVKPPPVHPVDPPAPVRPDPIEPVKPPNSPDTPPKNPNEPEVPPRLTGDPAKPPVKDIPGASCGLKRGTCRPGADANLKIDENYDRAVDPLPGGSSADVAKKAGLNGPEANWFKTTMDNGPAARKQFEDTIVPEFDKTLNPKNNPQSPFKDSEEFGGYQMFLEQERGLFGTAGGHQAPFIQTQNNHGKNPTMVVEQMFKERDLYNGCEKCTFDALGVEYKRPALPRPEGVPQVHVSQGLADNWRVTAAQAGVDPKKIDNFAMNNVDTPESKELFKGLFKDGETDKTFPADSDGFKVVEKSVQAKVIRRELDTETATFGNKVITGHRLFKDRNTYHMITIVKDA